MSTAQTASSSPAHTAQISPRSGTAVPMHQRSRSSAESAADECSPVSPPVDASGSPGSILNSMMSQSRQRAGENSASSSRGHQALHIRTRKESLDSNDDTNSTKVQNIRTATLQHSSQPLSPRTIVNVLQSEPTSHVEAEHLPKIDEDQVYDYTDDTHGHADFTVTLTDEPHVRFIVHRTFLRTVSDYFDGILEDESGRRSIELGNDVLPSTSGDLLLFFDAIYERRSIQGLAPAVIVQQAKLSHFFYCEAYSHRCEAILINQSSSPRTTVRRLHTVHSTPRGGSPNLTSVRTGSSRASPAHNSNANGRSLLSEESHNESAITSSPSLQSLRLADRLNMDSLKAAAIDQLTNQGGFKDVSSDELQQTLNSVSKETLVEMLTAVVEKNY